MHYNDCHSFGLSPAKRRLQNRNVFAETMSVCKVGRYTAPSGKSVELPAIDETLRASVFYRDPPKVDDVPKVGTSICDAVNEDCIETARKLVADGYRPIMLNMANRHTPGGGVLYGARAQEESLFRQSNLCVSLYQFDERHAGLLGLPLGSGRYPMDPNTGGIYSGRVTFFRKGSRDGDALVESPFECAVVSVAAINHPDLTGDGRLVDWAAVATKSKIRTMLRIGLLHGHDAIVLGAWGCGAFCNPPEHMAQLFHEVLRETEFADKYRAVRFAVIEDHNSRNSNFAPFDREFNRRAAPPEAIARNDLRRMRTMERNRAKGMLWGLIVGDAFGSPIQFSGKDSHPWITEMVACPIFNLPPGYWTDDGSMAMCIMDSYVRKGGYDLKDIGDTFVKWFREGYLSSWDGRAFDIGRATRNACRSIASCNEYANGSEDSQGNGSIMRFAPSYLLALKERSPSSVMHEISDLTHRSSRVREVVDRFARILDEHSAGVRTAEVSPYRTREDVDNSGWAVSTLDAALWAFNTTDSFEDGLIAAVNLGGDSDSIGAVFGQIAGAYYGFDAIPKRWVRAVKTWREVDSLIDRFLCAIGI